MNRLSEMTWESVARLAEGRLVAVLPVGATEAHGPHLPLGTDDVIAEAMARDGAARLGARGVEAVVLPTVSYTPAPFAGRFAGTVSIRPETLVALVVDVVRSLTEQGVDAVVVANAHLDPAHLGALREAADRCRAEGLALVFPDLTRREWARRLTDEFRTGACHAGRFEGSVVLAERPELVRETIMRDLPANPASLSTAIREGKGTFDEAGGPRAYFGWPADATAEEGRDTVGLLGSILEDAVVAHLQGPEGTP